jgi:uncharacterized protein (TIGR03032 family)
MNTDKTQKQVNEPATFELNYPREFAELLNAFDISLAISTYQAGKLVFFSPINNEKIIQLPRTFPSAMGMATSDNLIAVSTKSTVEVLKYSTAAAIGYPSHPGIYEGLYLPRCTYHTGYLALHDMVFLGEKLMVVNTMFSAICSLSHQASFDPIWQPPFISALEPEDRCHLNGMCVENGEIKYLTALGSTDTSQGWRENKMNGGILMEYPSGKIILDGLAMPHSPRIFDGKLYVLNSAQGTLLEVDRNSGESKIITQLGAFARGMDRFGDYLFIGTSKLRHTNEIFKRLPIAETSFAGIIVVHIPSGEIVATAKYETSVEEIYDVKVLANKRRPNILSPSMEIQESSIIINNQAYWTVEDAKEEKSEVISSSKEQKNFTINIFKQTSPEELKKLFGNMIAPGLDEAINKEKTSKNLNLIVVSDKNNPIGLGVFEAKSNQTALIWSVFVKQEYRKKGLATILMSQMANILNKNGLSYIELALSAADNTEAMKSLLKKHPNINIVEEEL